MTDRYPLFTFYWSVLKYVYHNFYYHNKCRDFLSDLKKNIVINKKDILNFFHISDITS